MQNRTKIGATLGPACQTKEIIGKMVEAGILLGLIFHMAPIANTKS
jgi:pyruvate kinase